MQVPLETQNVARQSAKKGTLLLRVALAVLLFTGFIKLDALFQPGSTLVAWGWSMPAILLAFVLIRTITAGTAVLLVLPVVLGFSGPRTWLPGFLRLDRKAVLAGVLSFALFGALAAILSLAMGIWVGDLSAAFAWPDHGPDPDVIGWGYFLLALIPGIWEELAFRGLILSRLRERFSITASVLLSAAFFAAYHFSNLLTQPPSQVVGGVIMALLFGIGWGVLTARARSVLPAMIAHYMVDSMGQIFLGVDASNPALSTGFFLLLTLTFPVANILLARALYRKAAQ
jgi:membrane protease YdiL (CAAX protease family)